MMGASRGNMAEREVVPVRPNRITHAKEHQPVGRYAKHDVFNSRFHLMALTLPLATHGISRYKRKAETSKQMTNVMRSTQLTNITRPETLIVRNR
jgi:hypothetical protein